MFKKLRGREILLLFEDKRRQRFACIVGFTLLLVLAFLAIEPYFASINLMAPDSVASVSSQRKTMKEESFLKQTTPGGVFMKHGVCQKGIEPWTWKELFHELPRFLQVFDRRPGDNFHGSPLMHQFAMWCVVRMLRPRHIIESGIWNGRGTWLLRQAAPDAQLILLDPSPQQPMIYIDNSSDSLYFTNSNFRDFSTLSTWNDVTLDLSRTLAFIDDHQTPLKRIPQAKKMGIKHLLFDDNYWLGFSDCLSLKQACACLQDSHYCRLFKFKDNWSALIRNITADDVADVSRMFESLEIYAEFPQIWNAFSKGVTSISKDSRNFLFNTTSGISLLKKLNLRNLPALNQLNGRYTYFNIAYVRL